MEPVVWLITGSSSVGKTTLGTDLARRIGAAHIGIDDIARAEPEGAINPFRRRPACWDAPVGSLVDQLIAKGHAIEPMATEIIATHLALERPVVVEGEGIHPALVDRFASDSVAVGYVIEDDPQRLERSLRRRSFEFRSLTPRRRAAIVQMNLRYGAWLAGEAIRAGQPVITCRPWSTLVDRYLAAVNGRAMRH